MTNAHGVTGTSWKGSFYQLFKPDHTVRLAKEGIVAYVSQLVAEKVVKVPEMAESISEGTLKQWSKRSSTEAR